ncbi:raffinose/stachyose/melibiose transport system substrate-binding protein [Paenibacillus phyllosphaerae]|uniref:Raffinose/stachyose/melibiose transport system substrate-binding protein n=1 Tax=Paenibacillus phyllosphaerae TaxID=274593 RepID=A0A7W5B375_9BACL|nr:extracellular solute-binding protein [Paenibacillus phyllosphaerae]MBB3113595.1 raffinose/stachyose/melibiose transport system substrate-binding protein [Paenibacillus phyllosphaerae]
MSRGFSLLAAAVITVSLIMTSCGSDQLNEANGSNAEGNVYKDVKLTLRHTQIKESSQVRLRILQDVVAQTESEYPGLKIEMEGIDEVVNRDQKLKAEMAAGNPPEIFEVFGGSDLKLYVKAGRMMELTPIIELLGLKDKFASLDEFTVDGKIYGLPFGGYSEGFFYNKEIFAKLGLAVPATWEELLKTADTIRDNGIVPFGLAAKDAWVNGMLWNTIAERYVGIDAFYKLLTGETKWTDPGFIQSFEAYAELVNRDYFTKGALGLPYAEQGGQLLNGEAAMVFTGTWDANRFVGSEAGGLDGKIGFFNFPSVPGGLGDQTSINASYSNGFGFSSKLSDDKKAMVIAFIHNFYTEKVQKRTLLEDKVLPSMRLSDLSGVDPLMSEVQRAMANATSSWRAFDSIVQPTVGADLGVGLQELIGKVKTPHEVAEHIQEKQEKANLASREK